LILGVYGPRNSGKTALIEKLIQELSPKYTIATVKHIYERDFSLDSSGTDTWRHGKAGSKLVVASSNIETAFLLKKVTTLREIQTVMKKVMPIDLILVEGFRGEDIPKVSIGKVKEEKNTIFRYQDNFEDIVGYISDEILTERIYEKLPKLDCGKCGMTCIKFARSIFDKSSDYSDCPYYSERSVLIKINDKTLPMGKFAKDMVAETIKGMLSSLKGVRDKEIRSIQIEIKEE